MLILASTSKYRKLLLRRFAIPFSCESPKTDEEMGENESPTDLVSRLACEKARAISRKHPDAIVIGSDQLAVFNGRLVGKPGNHQTAIEQLSSFSGRCVEFHTAVCVQKIQSGFSEQYTDCTRVYFRVLRREEIERYLAAEKPYDCAGSFKSEALGITLFEKIVSDDPTALIGLPLIQTANMLRKAGLQLP